MEIFLSSDWWLAEGFRASHGLSAEAVTLLRTRLGWPVQPSALPQLRGATAGLLLKTPEVLYFREPFVPRRFFCIPACVSILSPARLRCANKDPERHRRLDRKPHHATSRLCLPQPAPLLHARYACQTAISLRLCRTACTTEQRPHARVCRHDYRLRYVLLV